nr:hypothetical protein CFP56_65007 [Quercus suber]
MKEEACMWIDDDQDNESGKKSMTKILRLRAIDIHKSRQIHIMSLGSKSKVLRRTKALKMKDEKLGGVGLQLQRTTPKVVLAGLPKIIDNFTVIGTLIKDKSFGFYK